MSHQPPPHAGREGRGADPWFGDARRAAPFLASSWATQVAASLGLPGEAGGGGATENPLRGEAAPAASRQEEREVCVVLDDILARVPTEALQPGLHDPDFELRLPLDELAEGIVRGRAAITVSRLAELYPEIFLPVPEGDRAVPLPLQKLVQQLGAAPREKMVAGKSPSAGETIAGFSTVKAATAESEESPASSATATAVEENLLELVTVPAPAPVTLDEEEMLFGKIHPFPSPEAVEIEEKPLTWALVEEEDSESIVPPLELESFAVPADDPAPAAASEAPAVEAPGKIEIDFAAMSPEVASARAPLENASVVETKPATQFAARITPAPKTEADTKLGALASLTAQPAAEPVETSPSKASLAPEPKSAPMPPAAFVPKVESAPPAEVIPPTAAPSESYAITEPAAKFTPAPPATPFPRTARLNAPTPPRQPAGESEESSTKSQPSPPTELPAADLTAAPPVAEVSPASATAKEPPRIEPPAALKLEPERTPASIATLPPSALFAKPEPSAAESEELSFGASTPKPEQKPTAPSAAATAAPVTEISTTAAPAKEVPWIEPPPALKPEPERTAVSTATLPPDEPLARVSPSSIALEEPLSTEPSATLEQEQPPTAPFSETTAIPALDAPLAGASPTAAAAKEPARTEQPAAAQEPKAKSPAISAVPPAADAPLAEPSSPAAAAEKLPRVEPDSAPDPEPALAAAPTAELAPPDAAPAPSPEPVFHHESPSATVRAQTGGPVRISAAVPVVRPPSLVSKAGAPFPIEETAAPAGEIRLRGENPAAGQEAAAAAQPNPHATPKVGAALPTAAPPPIFGLPGEVGPAAQTPTETAPVQPTPPPAPRLPLSRFDQEALRTIFMTEETLDLPAVAARIAEMPGLTGVALVHGENAAFRGQLPKGLYADSLREMAEKFLSGETPFQPLIGAVEAATFAGSSDAFTLFRRGPLLLGVVHAARGFIPGVREKLLKVAEELGN